MATYKIGNKITGIIRSYCAGKLGNAEMQYDNQPYTILRDISATVNFSNDTKDNTTGRKNLLEYNADTIKEVRLNNVLLTEKILNLIYKTNNDKLFSTQEIYESDEKGVIYLNTPETIYQVFIYDDEGNLEDAMGSYQGDTITVLKSESPYSIYYSYIGEKSFLLDKPDNYYIKLDLNIIGNEDNNTQDMCLHIEKGSVKIDKSMYFNNNSNAIDLTIVVIHTGLDYITLK